MLQAVTPSSHTYTYMPTHMAEMHFQWPSRKQEKAISTEFYEHLLLTPRTVGYFFVKSII